MNSSSMTANTTVAFVTTNDLIIKSALLPLSPSTLSSLLISSYNYNYSDVPEFENITEEPYSLGSYCDGWGVAQHKLFQAANFFFAAAFMVPRSFKASIFALRIFLTAGFMLEALWAGVSICSLDTMLWCLSLGLFNGIHSLILACNFLPPALAPELTDLYLKFFKPYKVSKKHFQELAKDARLHYLDSGQTYATESVSPGDQRLSILLKGRLKVSCSNTYLHDIQAYQFVDSPEWEATHNTLNSVFQVTIKADTSSMYICWTRIRLMRILRHRPILRSVFHALIGKDITGKLYALNQQLRSMNAATESSALEPYRGVTRSASVDAVNTEVAGKVRSMMWKSPEKSSPQDFWPQEFSKQAPSRIWPGCTSRQNWCPVVANHFPAKSPFLAPMPYDYSKNANFTLNDEYTDYFRSSQASMMSPLLKRQHSGKSYKLLPQSLKLERKLSSRKFKETI